MTEPVRKRGHPSPFNFMSEQIESNAAGLKSAHLAILRLSVDKTYVEIAAALGLAKIGTVRSRLNRARTALAALVAQTTQEESS